MRVLEGYWNTEGLDRFPPDQQFCVYLKAHKRLKKVDAAYRARCRNFLIKTFVACLIANAIIGWSLSPSVAGWVHGLPVERPDLLLFLAMAPLCITLVVVLSYSVIVVNRHSRWMNTKVAEEIKKWPLSQSSQGSRERDFQPASGEDGQDGSPAEVIRE